MARGILVKEFPPGGAAARAGARDRSTSQSASPRPHSQLLEPPSSPKLTRLNLGAHT